MSPRRRDILSGIGISLVVSLIGTASVASTTERVLVHPEGNDVGGIRAPITEVGGSITFEYDHFEFVAAEIPAERRETLAAMPGVALIEDDDDAGIPSGWAPSLLDLLAPGGEIDCSLHPPQRGSWGWERIGANDVEQDGSGIDIGILDTGIESDHCSLEVAGGRNFTDPIPNPNFEDRHGHGTHVAGIAGALDNDLGVVGVAPKADLYAVKVLDDRGTGSYSALIAGIDWCMSNDIPLISMSLGGETASTSVDTAIEAASDAGHLLICAAGNNENAQDGACSEETMTYPATHPEVIAVAAMNEDDTFASYSSVGQAIELLAPGTGIDSAYVDNRYARASGTSMACPFVTGVAALVWEDTDLEVGTNETIREILRTNAESVLGTCEEGFGLVDAVSSVGAEPPSTDDGEPSDAHADGADTPPMDEDSDAVSEDVALVIERAPRWSLAGLVAGVFGLLIAIVHRFSNRD